MELAYLGYLEATYLPIGPKALLQLFINKVKEVCSKNIYK
jgi:hypothetical protein